ncbi:PIN domain-containing protein [Prauserella sp. ASG 168]|uniref:Ribonuclease VapC n=2 Tax=Prauserella cavernicola TaxID=2800127 RepID=A0A934V4V6_9PSEU|nr:PIN domain-containing protein [Prauserella cavernicola]
MVKALTGSGPRARELADRLSAAELHAPHLLDAEVGDVVRRQALHGRLAEDVAAAALWSLDAVLDARYPHAGPLARAAWELRDRVRFYDALYVALAARLELPLLTCDARLARAHRLPCVVEVV